MADLSPLERCRVSLQLISPIYRPSVVSQACHVKRHLKLYMTLLTRDSPVLILFTLTLTKKLQTYSIFAAVGPGLIACKE